MAAAAADRARRSFSRLSGIDGRPAARRYPCERCASGDGHNTPIVLANRDESRRRYLPKVDPQRPGWDRRRRERMTDKRWHGTDRHDDYATGSCGAAAARSGARPPTNQKRPSPTARQRRRSAGQNPNSWLPRSGYRNQGVCINTKRLLRAGYQWYARKFEFSNSNTTIRGINRKQWCRVRQADKSIKTMSQSRHSDISIYLTFHFITFSYCTTCNRSNKQPIKKKKMYLFVRIICSL